MDKDEYREEVLKELMEQRLFLKNIKETIETCAVIALGVFLFLVAIMFIVLFK